MTLPAGSAVASSTRVDTQTRPPTADVAGEDRVGLGVAGAGDSHNKGSSNPTGPNTRMNARTPTSAAPPS